MVKKECEQDIVPRTQEQCRTMDLLPWPSSFALHTVGMARGALGLGYDPVVMLDFSRHEIRICAYAGKPRSLSVSSVARQGIFPISVAVFFLYKKEGKAKSEQHLHVRMEDAMLDSDNIKSFGAAPVTADTYRSAVQTCQVVLSDTHQLC